MPQSKLTDILSSFDKSTWTRCKNYVQTQCKEKSKEKVLFDRIYKYKLDLGHPDLSRTSIFTALFPNGNKAAFNNLTSRLCRRIEDFIILEEMRGQEYEWDRRLMLAKYYKRKGITKHFMTESASVIKDLEGSSKYDLSKRLKLFLTRFEIAYSEIDRQERLPYFNYAIEDLTTYFENMKMLFRMEIKNQKRLLDVQRYDDMSIIDKDLYHFLRELNQLVNHRDDESFRFLKEKVLEIYPQMLDKLAEITLIYLVNHCYFKMKKGDVEAPHELLHLYEEGLANGILLSNGLLAEPRFLNIVEAKSNLDTDTDHEPFIKDWLGRTETAYPESVGNIARAYVHFGREEYEEADKYLKDEETRQANINLSLRTRWMSICCIYALHDKHAHYNIVLDTHSRFFRRNEAKIGSANCEGSLNLIRIIRMFREKKDISLILEKVNNFDYLIFRHWILKEIRKSGQLVPDFFDQ